MLSFGILFLLHGVLFVCNASSIPSPFLKGILADFTKRALSKLSEFEFVAFICRST